MITRKSNGCMAKKVVCVFLCLAVVFTSIFIYTDIFSSDEIASALTLKQGMTGSNVKKLQTRLKDWGLFNSAIDGIYGSKTTQAVKAFQKKKGLTADGIAGAKTLKALDIAFEGDRPSSLTSAEANLLARCVYSEARGEPYLGQVAVAAIVLNRVRSSSFPNTISGVIYQPWAFTAVNDGQINLTPNDSAKRAVKDAMSGWDPTNGCLYYYNPRTATNQWIRQKAIKLTIGKHVFCL